MTIRKGEDWGRVVPRPERLRTVGSDHDLASALCDGTGRPVIASGGDLARTLGSSPDDERPTLNELPIDLLRVSVDDRRELTAVAHVVARRPRRAGSWFRGEVLFVMNAQFYGAWNLIPRGHPNDGRADLLRVEPSVGVRQRVEAARRAPASGHLPHSGLTTTRLTSREFVFESPMEILVDGVVIGRWATLRVEVDPDAAVVHA